MSFIAGVLTVFLVLNSLLLILLVLVQLPKKDAGAGLAFGSGAADALFGAGSGNALTKITKWGTVVFIAVTILVGWIQDSAQQAGNNTSTFLKEVNQKQMQTPAPAPAPAVPQSSAQPSANGGLSAAPLTANPAASQNSGATTNGNPAK
jgi:protein translocase SecG subunit